MNNKLDPETLKIPAYMRKKMIVSQSRQKLILTALDRKQARLPHDSEVALAPVRLAPAKRRALSPGPVKISAAAPATLPGFMDLPCKCFPAIGNVTHYLDKIGVAIIMLDAQLKEGEHILVEGENEVFTQKVEEIQIDRKPVEKAKKGSHIGLKVMRPAKVNGKIFRFSF